MKQQKKRPQGKNLNRNSFNKGMPRNPQEWEAHYEELANFYESNASLEVMAKGVPTPTAKLRSLSKKNAKLISIRMPILDLIGVKRIAAKKEQPYQKLIIQAVENLIDEEEEKERAELPQRRKLG